MNTTASGQTGILGGLAAITRRDLLLAWKRPGDVLNPLFFFAMVCTLFPLAVGPSADQLTFSGPGVLWVAALLSTLLFPVTVPLFISAMKCTTAVLEGKPLSDVSSWLTIAAAFDLLFLFVGLMTFEFVVEE